MTCVQRFLANDRNAVASGSITATEVKESAQSVHRGTVTRTGNGVVALTGSYTGADDATFEVEITAGGTTKRVSEPTWAGAGLGTLATPTATNAVAAQTFTVTLIDRGTDTLHAKTQIAGVEIQAIAPGAGGNAITLTVDASGLSRAATDYSTLSSWGTGEDSKVGDQWNFGGLPLLANGTLDPATARLAFGDDPQVYRQYRVHTDGVWNYFLTPPLAREVAAGTPVKAVTGTYTVTVSDGTPETPLTSIVTLYDFLAALSASALVEPVGVVANDTLPGGQAAIDLPFRTDAHALAPIYDAVSEHLTEIQDVVVAATAKTEALAVECVNNDVVGEELWGVTGPVSGTHPQAITGIAYENDDAAGFLIPGRLIETEVTGQTDVEVRYASRDVGATTPPICVNPIVLGVQAATKTVTFTYRVRPTGECICHNQVASGFVSNDCLGLSGSAAVATLDATYSTKLTALYLWKQTQTNANTYTTGNSVNGASLDLQLIDGIAKIFADALVHVYSDAGALSDWDDLYDDMVAEVAAFAGVSGVAAGTGASAVITEWEADTAFPLGTVVYPTAANDGVGDPGAGREYVVIASAGDGKTHATTEPTWVSGGATVVDDQITWRDLGFRTLPTVDEWTNNGSLATYGGVDSYGKVYAAGDKIQPSSANANGHTYYVIKGGRLSPDIAASPTAEPSWPIDGTTVTDTAGVEYQDLGFDRGPGTESGTAGAAATPGADLAADVTDVATFQKRYRTQMEHLLIQVGVVPGKGNGLAGRAACWTDVESANWWEAPGYMPAFTNQIYHSTRRDEDGNIVSTQEFALAIVVACPGALVEGDQVVFSIGGVTGGGKTYQLGDRVDIPLIAAAPVALSGGATGNDTHTWSVVGTVAGAQTNYAVQHGSEAPYSVGGLTFTIWRGGIPFELGDAWGFAVEAAQFQWKKGTGGWSAAVDIPDSGTVALSDGLFAGFTEGAAPSFVTGDTAAFVAEQPYSPAHILVPDEDAWQWDTASAAATVDLGSVKSIDALCVGRHFLPAGTVVTVEGDDTSAGAPWDWSETLTWRAGPIAKIVARTARYLKLSVSSAEDGGILWFWAGEALTTTHSAERLVLQRTWDVRRGAGANPVGSYAGKGMGGEISYAPWLSRADVDALIAMLDDSQENSYPVILVPNFSQPERAALMMPLFDRVAIVDQHQYQPADATRATAGVLPGFSMTIPFAGVIDG